MCNEKRERKKKRNLRTSSEKRVKVVHLPPTYLLWDSSSLLFILLTLISLFLFLS